MQPRGQGGELGARRIDQNDRVAVKPGLAGCAPAQQAGGKERDKM